MLALERALTAIFKRAALVLAPSARRARSTRLMRSSRPRRRGSPVAVGAVEPGSRGAGEAACREAVVAARRSATLREIVKHALALAQGRGVHRVNGSRHGGPRGRPRRSRPACRRGRRPRVLVEEPGDLAGAARDRKGISWGSRGRPRGRSFPAARGDARRAPGAPARRAGRRGTAAPPRPPGSPPTRCDQLATRISRPP